MPDGHAVPVARHPIVIGNADGLHLRAATLFACLAGRFASEVRVHRDGRAADGKSILDLVTLAAECGTRLDLEARGSDAEATLAALAELVSARLHEVGDGVGRAPEPHHHEETTMLETRKTGTIRAVGDDGREYVIQEYSSYQDPGVDGGTPREPSVVTYQTEECIPVNRVGEELYEVQTEPDPALARPRADA